MRGNKGKRRKQTMMTMTMEIPKRQMMA